jgi:hypothetical protein
MARVLCVRVLDAPPLVIDLPVARDPQLIALALMPGRCVVRPLSSTRVGPGLPLN